MPNTDTAACECVTLTFNLVTKRYPREGDLESTGRMMLYGLLLALELVSDNDSALATRLQDRDPDAMAALYDRFGRRVYSVVLAIVRDAAIAEDLTQEAFLKVWTRIQFFDAARGALGPWLLTIARNRALDHVRSASVRATRNAWELDVREHPSLYVEMEREVLNEEHSRLIRGAVAKLSEKQRKVIEFAYYEGLSQTEMAERMGEPLGTVKTWVRTALKALREELGQKAIA